MPSLLVLTSAINLIALGLAIWLGLYIATRSQRLLAWLAAGTLWALAAYFFNRVVSLNFPDQSVVPGGWGASLAAAFWYHVSTIIWPRSLGRRLLVPLAYALAAVFLLLISQTDLIFVSPNTELNVAISQIRTGPLYPVEAAFLLVCTVLALSNFWAARRTNPRSLPGQRTALMQATIVALFGSIYLIGADFLRLPLPILIGDLALCVAVLLIGYAVARYNAILEGRAANADLPYTAAAISLIAMGHLAVAWLSYRLYGISLAALTLLFVLVIGSHTFYDVFRSQLDRFFYRRSAVSLRQSLRALAGEVGDRDILDEALHDTLVALCHTLGVERALVALQEKESLWITASVPAEPVGGALTDVMLPEDTVMLEHLPPSLAGMAVVSPIICADEKLGIVAVGPRTGGYTVDELAALADVADRIGGAVYATRATETATAILTTQLEEFRGREREWQRQIQDLVQPVESELSEAELMRLVEDALRHLYDFAYLGQHGLGHLEAVEVVLAERSEAVTLLERGQALRDVLVQTLEQLRPPGAEPRGDQAASRREWHAYLILRESYVDGIPTRDTMNRLYISKGTYNRARRAALRGLARTLAEQGASNRGA